MPERLGVLEGRRSDRNSRADGPWLDRGACGLPGRYDPPGTQPVDESVRGTRDSLAHGGVREQGAQARRGRRDICQVIGTAEADGAAGGHDAVVPRTLVVDGRHERHGPAQRADLPRRRTGGRDDDIRGSHACEEVRHWCGDA